MPSVFIKTYGCQMNERDSEAVAARFLARGYTLAPSETAADVILLNTCSVRDAAEKKAAGKMAHVAASARKHHRGVVLGYLGCMAQSHGPELLARTPGVRLVVGTQKLHRTVDHVDALLAGREEPVCDIGEEAGSEAQIRDHVLAFAGTRPPVKAYVSIMQGCNQHCTFCIVPQTRGEERSRGIDDIVAECRELLARGVREITLLGQIVTSYGRRLIPVRDGRSPFVQLLEAVDGLPGLARIRFTSPHPKGYGDDLVAAYARLPRLCASAHLPVQSGSDRVLGLMHRGYTRARFLEIVGKLRSVRPDIGLTTDLIVGFPGETEADFEATLSLVREADFDCAYVFKYSPRRGTPAAAMPDALPPEVIEERHGRLLALVDEFGSRHLNALVDHVVPVLVEGPSRRNPARLEGRTSCNKIVVFEGAARHVGEVLPLRIVGATGSTLYGDPAVLNPD
jgi:tRNA-2-methylthio-N6-dimethylallyladenosine synthase